MQHTLSVALAGRLRERLLLRLGLELQREDTGASSLIEPGRRIGPFREADTARAPRPIHPRVSKAYLERLIDGRHRAAETRRLGAGAAERLAASLQLCPRRRRCLFPPTS